MLYTEKDKACRDNVNTLNVPFLSLHAPQNGKRLSERKSKSVKLAKLYYKKAETLKNATAEAMRKRAGRVFGCCSRREVAVSAGGYAYNLHTHRCRDRNCIECQRVRAFVLQQKIREITPELIKQTDQKDGLIFGTLTIKNPPVKELKAYLKILSAAFTRLMRRKDFKQVAVGGFRCFEVTRGEAGDEFCHPHIHFLLQVRAEYFSRKSPLYIKSETWAEAWTDCLEKEVVKTGREFNRADYPSGKAFVKILRVQAPGYTRENRKYATISTLQNEGDQVINYVLKYTAKEDENSKKSLVKDDAFFYEYDSQIKNIRAISFFGIYKTLIGELAPKAYDEAEIRAQLAENQAKCFTALWDDQHGYVALPVSEEEALNLKRTNIVNSIQTTLKAQIQNKNMILDMIIDAIRAGDFVKANSEIEQHNALMPRVYKTFKRLEKAGEVIEYADGFWQHFHSFMFKNSIWAELDNLVSAEELAKVKEETKLVLEVCTEAPF